MHHRRGFTLIELLVVVSIIMLLIAILLPSLRSAREMGRIAVCGASMHQIGIMTQYYLNDYRQAYPYGPDISPRLLQHPHDSRDGWDEDATPPQQQFFKYIRGSTDVWICPTDPSPENYNWWAYDNHPDITEGSSYMFSEHALFGVTRSKKRLFRQSDIYRPDTFGWVVDGRWCPNGWTWRKCDPYDPAHDPTEPAGIRLDWDHNVNVNVLFGDFSARAMPQNGELAYDVRSNPVERP